MVTLLAEVATTYIQYRQFERELLIANENIAAQKETLKVTTKKFEAGLKDASELEVAQSQALVYTNLSRGIADARAEHEAVGRTSWAFCSVRAPAP